MTARDTRYARPPDTRCRIYGSIKSCTEFKRFEAFAGIFIAAYLCLPLLWAFLIYRVRHQLDPATRDHATFGEDTDALLFLFTDYRPSCKYTECMEM